MTQKHYAKHYAPPPPPKVVLATVTLQAAVRSLLNKGI